MPKIDTTPVVIDKKVNKLLTKIDEQNRVIVHCEISVLEPTYIRIWPSTYLIDNDSNHKSKLIHAENIIYFPHWQMIDRNAKHHFILIFEGLPKSCTVFSLIEDIPDKGGFVFENLIRNSKDIYSVVL